MATTFIKRSTGTARKQILVVDDHPMMRTGLAQIVNAQPGLEVFGEAGSPAEALEKLSPKLPDLIMADLTMKGGSGFEFIREVQARHPELPVLVVSMHDENVYAERALRAGARGYIMKEESPDQLITAILRVLEGGIYLSENMSTLLLRSFTNAKSRSAKSPLQCLTDREFEIYQIIGRGKTTEEIAALLRISPQTVDVHRAQIKDKLNLKSGTALVHHAVQWVETEGSGE